MSISATFISLIMCVISIKSTWRHPQHYRILKSASKIFCYRAYICTTEELNFYMYNEHAVPQAAIVCGIVPSHHNKTVKRTPQNPEPLDHSETNDAWEEKFENLHLVTKTNGVSGTWNCGFCRHGAFTATALALVCVIPICRSGGVEGI